MFFTEEFPKRAPDGLHDHRPAHMRYLSRPRGCLRAGLGLNWQLSVAGGSGIARFSGIWGGALGSERDAAPKMASGECKNTGYVRELDFGDAVIRFEDHEWFYLPSRINPTGDTEERDDPQWRPQKLPPGFRWIREAAAEALKAYEARRT